MLIKDKYFKSWNLKRLIYFIKSFTAVSMFPFLFYHHGIYDLPSFLVNATHELTTDISFLKHSTGKIGSTAR